MIGVITAIADIVYTVARDLIAAVILRYVSKRIEQH